MWNLVQKFRKQSSTRQNKTRAIKHNLLEPYLLWLLVNRSRYSQVSAEALRVMISPADRTLTAELTTAAMWSRSAPMRSATSTHCAATKAAAEATAMDVLVEASSVAEAAVAAVTAAIPAAKPAMAMAACTSAFWLRVASFFLFFRSLIQLPSDIPECGNRTLWKVDLRYCRSHAWAPSNFLARHCKTKESQVTLQCRASKHKR